MRLQLRYTFADAHEHVTMIFVTALFFPPACRSDCEKLQKPRGDHIDENEPQKGKIESIYPDSRQLFAGLIKSE